MENAMLKVRTSEEIIARDKARVTPALYHYTDVAFTRGEGIFLYDFEGRRYYDTAAGIACMNVGHCHPRVVRAVTEQVGTLMHAASHVGYLAPYVDILTKILSLAPSPLREGKGILLNSGSEAVEAAIKLARMVTGRQMILAFIGGFHGRPMGALSLTASSSVYRRHLGGLLVGVEHVPYPVCHRCTFGHGSHSPDDCCGQWRNMIQLTLDRLVHPDDLAAIVVEPILGEGGYQVPPDDFLPELRSICDRTGALLICDEVQTGLGRTGKWFGFQHSNIVPDIAILGKAIGGGLPLGGVIARADLMDAWWVSAHGTTYGGNPVACVAGLESLLITEDENLIENAVHVGDHMRDRLNQARTKLPIIGTVSGRGLMTGVELVTEDGEQLSLDKVKQIVKRMGAGGVIMTRCGPSSLRLTPPLIITMEQADDLLDIIFDVLRD